MENVKQIAEQHSNKLKLRSAFSNIKYATSLGSSFCKINGPFPWLMKGKIKGLLSTLS